MLTEQVIRLRILDELDNQTRKNIHVSCSGDI